MPVLKGKVPYLLRTYLKLHCDHCVTFFFEKVNCILKFLKSDRCIFYLKKYLFEVLFKNLLFLIGIIKAKQFFQLLKTVTSHAKTFDLFYVSGFRAILTGKLAWNFFASVKGYWKDFNLKQMFLNNISESQNKK